MAQIVAGETALKHNSLTVIPLGGQSELGQTLWALIYAGKILLIDAGAAHPTEELPGVDVLFPSTSFLQLHQDRIIGLVLTNAHAEHTGAVAYLLHHLSIPVIMGPSYVATFLAQCSIDSNKDTGLPCPVVQSINIGEAYSLDPFVVEWIRVNDAVADACALQIGTPEGTVIYTSSFKIDQTPVDDNFIDVRKLAQAGDSGVLLLIGDSAGVELEGYTPSEKAVIFNLRKAFESAPGRVIVVVPGTNTHRLQILFDLARQTNRKVALLGETLMRTAVSAAMAGHLKYDRSIELDIQGVSKLHDNEIVILATGRDGNAMDVIRELADCAHNELTLKEGDTVIFSAEVASGRSRQMAMILDQLLTLGVKAVSGSRAGVHVSKHASREELKLMLSIINPKYFIPAFGEGRHIMHHAQLAREWGMPAESIFALRNGDVLEIDKGLATICGAVEAEPVMFNLQQGDSVSQFSVTERRALSLEGIVTVGIVVDGNRKIISGPTFEVNAAGFMQSPEWTAIKPEIEQAVKDAVSRMTTAEQVGANESQIFEIAALRAAVREVVTKQIRSKLQSKPTVQVLVHELQTR